MVQFKDEVLKKRTINRTIYEMTIIFFALKDKSESE